MFFNLPHGETFDVGREKIEDTMEPVCCFANVTKDGADIYDPIQAPEFIINTIATRIGLSKEKITI